MKINVHAGHNPDGMIACGAVGIISESTQARKVKELLLKKLRSQGHTVRDCTCNNGVSDVDVLRQIIQQCNSEKVDLDISIHFNSAAKDYDGDGKTTGVECYVYPTNSGYATTYATKICEAISDLGFRNRGVKTSQNLYFLNNTKAQAILIECCFVDDMDDVQLYDAEKMAEAICKGITGKGEVLPEAINPNIPQWQVEGLKGLVAAGIIGDEAYWSARMDKNITVGEVVGLFGKMMLLK